MDELLKQMFSNELLNEESQKELLEAFKAEVEAAKAAAVEVAVAEAKVDLAAQFAADKEALVEALDTKITLYLNEEIQELKEDIERFRDLEAEFATRLVEEKEKIGLQVKADMAELVETLDVFLEERLTEEVKELKESIEEVKQIEFAKQVFESFENIYKAKFFKENGLTAKLDESATALAEKAKKLEETEAKLAKLVRAQEMSRVLEPLHGRTREIMEAVLISTPTSKLDSAYQDFIGRVLHDSAATVVETKTEKESASASVLAESDSTAETPVETKVVTGDSTVVEQVETPRQSFVSESEMARFKRVAGI